MFLNGDFEIVPARHVRGNSDERVQRVAGVWSCAHVSGAGCPWPGVARGPSQVQGRADIDRARDFITRALSLSVCL